jgi:hypothetical protein
MAVLAASAMSDSAVAGVIPQGDIGIQTLGGKVGSKLPVGTIMASNLWKQLNSITDAGEQRDDTVDNSLGHTPPDNGNPGQTSVGNDPTTQAGQVPEPGILGLFGAGLVALGVLRRRRG